MGNSNLANFTRLSPNRTAPRNGRITKITIHHAASVATAAAIANWTANASARASYNYIVGNDQQIALTVNEHDRSWASSSAANDNVAVTIGVCNSASGGQWPVAEATYNRMIDLLVDICRRNPGIVQSNGRPGMTFTGNASGSLTHHRMFSATSCPGDFLLGRFQDICNRVNSRLNNTAPPPPVVTPPAPTPPSSAFSIQVIVAALNIRRGPGTSHAVAGQISDRGIYTIIEENNGWGRLKSGAGWISLEPSFVRRLTAPTPPSNEFRVRVTANALNIRNQPTTSGSTVVGTITDKGTYTIVETRAGQGSNSGWGRLKSGMGWIALDHTQRV